MREHEIDDQGLTPQDPAEDQALDAALCPDCGGSGLLGGGETCPVCEGTGRPTHRTGGG